MKLYCFGVTTENSAIGVSFLIYTVIPFFWLAALLLSVNCGCHWLGWQHSHCFHDFSHCSHSTCSVPFWWVVNKKCDRLLVIGRILEVSRIRRVWGSAFVSQAQLLTCMVKCGKWMKPYVVSMTTLLCLMKFKLITGPISFFITMKSSAKLWSMMSNLDFGVADGFSQWPFANWIWKFWAPSILKMLAEACCLILSNSFWAIKLT